MSTSFLHTKKVLSHVKSFDLLKQNVIDKFNQDFDTISKKIIIFKVIIFH